MRDGGWRMEDGGWRMDDGGWRMEDGRWMMDDGRWTMAIDMGDCGTCFGKLGWWLCGWL
jgi:hypothetical protein